MHFNIQALEILTINISESLEIAPHLPLNNSPYLIKIRFITAQNEFVPFKISYQGDRG
jgi:hypothetical protein